MRLFYVSLNKKIFFYIGKKNPEKKRRIIIYKCGERGDNLNEHTGNSSGNPSTESTTDHSRYS